MAEKLPLVYVDGGVSQLPPSDSIVGIAYGSLTAGSGLSGGGDLNLGSAQVDIELAPNPSGLIFVGDSLGLDGVAQATATAALASGNAGLAAAGTALSSGVAAQSLASLALASGNAALNNAINFTGSSSLQFVAANDIQAGYAVGLDDAGKVQSIREALDVNSRSFGSAVVFESAYASYISTTYDSTNNRVVIAYRDQGGSGFGTVVIGTVSGTSISFGTPVVFRSASCFYISATYDSTNNRVVVAYSDYGNSGYGTAIVGAVSGTSISFGTAVVFESASTGATSPTHDSSNNRVIIAYQDQGNSSYGTAVVGTVSGTSISFGTPVLILPSQASYISATYDSTNNRVIIAYREPNNSSYGTAIVGTVSGTSISFGTSVVFESANTSYISATYDSTNNRVVIAYTDYTNSSYGTAIVGTVSGTSISFGTAVVFESAATGYNSITYDSSSNQVVIAYQDQNNSNYGTAVVGTVSGTSISFGTPVVIQSTYAFYISATYDSTNNRVVIAYTDLDNSYYGTAIVAGPDLRIYPSISSQTNFLGTAQATVASGTNLNVLLPSAIDYNQTGLTPGSFYYVDATTSGFTTASGEPSTWAGAYNWGPVAKAVSSSGLLLLNPL